MQTHSEPVATVLDRTSLLIEHSSHSSQFQHLTEQMLLIFSAVGVIPALARLEIQRYAALAALHDIGKKNVPKEILNKPGTLTAEEFSIVKAHTTQGCLLHSDSSKKQIRSRTTGSASDNNRTIFSKKIGHLPRKNAPAISYKSGKIALR
ncbi:MAG: hypothetical protein K2P20_07225 [Oscillospiraceae bacterium]|nr:hypothetical protein [Oscillospiraceae bacterium]